MKTLNNEDFVNIWAKQRGGKLGGGGGGVGGSLPKCWSHFHLAGENVLLALLGLRENFMETESFKGTIGWPHTV